MKIKGAILHQPVAVPGMMAPNVYINPTKVPGVKLEWENGLGLHITVKDRTGFFPQSTVAWVETDAEGKSKKAA